MVTYQGAHSLKTDFLSRYVSQTWVLRSHDPLDLEGCTGTRTGHTRLAMSLVTCSSCGTQPRWLSIHAPARLSSPVPGLSVRRGSTCGPSSTVSTRSSLPNGASHRQVRPESLLPTGVRDASVCPFWSVCGVGKEGDLPPPPLTVPSRARPSTCALRDGSQKALLRGPSHSLPAPRPSPLPESPLSLKGS